MTEDPEVKEAFDRLRGRLLTLIEASAVTPDQQSALKLMAKSLTYDCQKAIDGVLERE